MSKLLSNKLSLEALKERASNIASEELLSNISGGNMNACHDNEPDPREVPCDNI